jgi:CPA1 family monovalent cation:H+ antiporter
VQELTLFDITAVVLTLAAVFGYINHRWLKLPVAIGLVVIALTVSVCVMLLDVLMETLEYERTIRVMLDRIDFDDTLMKGMLSFLLFAGALHVDLEHLLSRKWAVIAMATAGVLISTLIVGYATFGLAWATDVAIPLPWCFVFGALIAPTDPVAVLGVLKTIKVPHSLEAKIAGESLFNDGVGVVVFTIVVVLASSGAAVTATDIAVLFLREAVGGAVLGLAAGYVAYRAMKAIDEYNLEVLITLALVTLTYSIGLMIHVSGPIAVVVAGVLIGNHGTRFAMSELTCDHVNKFWALTDEILNAVLFLLIGFEVLVLTITGNVVWLMALVIPVVLFARFVAVATPLSLLRLGQEFTKGAVPVLTWGGLRGGISVALALSLPDIPEKQPILAATYSVVVFSIVVQGLTFKTVVRRFVG